MILWPDWISFSSCWAVCDCILKSSLQITTIIRLSSCFVIWGKHRLVRYPQKSQYLWAEMFFLDLTFPHITLFKVSNRRQTISSDKTSQKIFLRSQQAALSDAEQHHPRKTATPATPHPSPLVTFSRLSGQLSSWPGGTSWGNCSTNASLIIVHRANLTCCRFPGNKCAVKASHATHILVVAVCVCVWASASCTQNNRACQYEYETQVRGEYTNNYPLSKETNMLSVHTCVLCCTQVYVMQLPEGGVHNLSLRLLSHLSRPAFDSHLVRASTKSLRMEPRWAVSKSHLANTVFIWPFLRFEKHDWRCVFVNVCVWPGDKMFWWLKIKMWFTFPLLPSNRCFNPKFWYFFSSKNNIIILFNILFPSTGRRWSARWKLRAE